MPVGRGDRERIESGAPRWAGIPRGPRESGCRGSRATPGPARRRRQARVGRPWPRQSISVRPGIRSSSTGRAQHEQRQDTNIVSAEDRLANAAASKTAGPRTSQRRADCQRRTTGVIASCRPSVRRARAASTAAVSPPTIEQRRPSRIGDHRQLLVALAERRGWSREVGVVALWTPASADGSELRLVAPAASSEGAGGSSARSSATRGSSSGGCADRAPVAIRPLELIGNVRPLGTMVSTSERRRSSTRAAST